MKFTIATFAALAVAVAAKPAFLNTAFDVEQGEPFTLKYSGCESGCTITLLNGDSKDLNDYKVLTADATGDSFTFTPSGLPTDTYAFKITDNESGEYNYSSQFEYKGTGVATTAESTTAVSTTAATSTSAAETSTAESTTAESTTKASSTKKATTLTKVTSEKAVSTPAHNSTTPASTQASSTEASETSATAESTTTGAESTATTVPDSGAARLSSSIALIAGAVMAMVYLN